MHHAERANDFDAAEWQAWERLLASEAQCAFVGASRACRPGESPTAGARRSVEGCPRRGAGLAISEDSEAISQGIDDFLEGNALFRRAKAWLHRKGGLTFSVRVIGTPLASGAHACRFAEGVDGLACLDELMALPGVAGARRRGPGLSRTNLSHKPGPTAPSLQASRAGVRVGWIWSLTR